MGTTLKFVRIFFDGENSKESVIVKSVGRRLAGWLYIWTESHRHPPPYHHAEQVAELEEQFRIVSIQRKKAEKVTADVLAILESLGISDASEEYCSSSDNDVTPHSLKNANAVTKEEESSVGSKQLGNELENFSCPKVDSFRVSGRSLSWKGCKDSSRSQSEGVVVLHLLENLQNIVLESHVARLDKVN